MWKRSRLRAKRNIPESMPTSAIAMKYERVVNGYFARGQPRHGTRRVPSRPLYARNSLGEMLAESSIL